MGSCVQQGTRNVCSTIATRQYVYSFTTTDSKSFTLWSPDWSVVHTFVVHATFMFKQRGKLLGLFISGSRHWSVWLHVKSERFPFFPFPFFPGPGVFPFFPFPFIPFPFFPFPFFPFPFFPTPYPRLSCEDITRQSCAMVSRWRIFGDFLCPVFSASRVLHVSDLHRKFALIV